MLICLRNVMDLLPFQHAILLVIVSLKPTGGSSTRSQPV